MSKTRKSARLGRGLSTLLNQPVPVDAPAPDAEPAAEPTDAPMPPPADADAPPSEASAAPSPDDPPADDATEGIHRLPVNAITPNPNQPRKRFDEQALAELADSIRQAGVMQPIVVRPARDAQDADASFELVAGERRWRAAQLAELAHIPAIVRDLTDQQLAEWALIENLQREDLNPIERAVAFQQLIEQFNLRHDDVAQRVGVNRSTVTNLLRLLALDEQVREFVAAGQLSAGQARALAGLSDASHQLALARQAIAEAWSVRKIEEAVRQANVGDTPAPAAAQPRRTVRSAQLADLERQVAEQLHTRVRIKPGRKKGAGTLSIEFYDLDHFDSLLKQLGVETE